MQIRDVERSSLRAFSLKKACGQAGICRATLHLPEDQGRTWLGRIGQVLAVSTDAPDETPLFFGAIERVAMRNPPSGALVEICARSSALAERAEARRRIFQKQGKTFGDILDAKRLKMQNCGLEIDNDLKSQICDPLVFQRRSNFDFIRSMATATGRKFWTLDDREGAPGLAVKFCLDKSVKKFTGEKIFSLCRINTTRGREMELSSREYCPLGRLATVPDVDGKFLVISMRLALENECDIYSYILEEFTEKGRAFAGFEENAAVLPGKIESVADPDHKGRVRIAIDPTFAEDDDEDKAWLPWLTPYAGAKAGIVFLPDKGDPARMILSSGNGVVQGTARENALPEEAQNVANKYAGNNFQERIIWKENALELRSGENYVILTPNDITIKLDDASIVLDKENMRATLGGEIAMNGKSIALAAGEDARMSGKNAIMEASGDAGINARDIAINAQSTTKIGARVELG